MPKIEAIAPLAGYRREDFSVCLGCKICGSVCTINDLSLNANPQELLLKLFLQQDVTPESNLLRYCTNCYNCTDACPWGIRIPEVIRALRDEMNLATTFENAFKSSVRRWGRVYEPFVFLKAFPFLVRQGYLKYMVKWTEYINFHLPHRVKKEIHPETKEGKSRPSGKESRKVT
jgi:heterodisulfide reductase subunit C